MKLLEPFSLGSLRLPNRIAMAPLARFRAAHGKIATELMAEYYAQRAGAGLIISEATEVDPRSAPAAPARPGLFNAAQSDGWARVTERVHRAGGRIFVQLTHLGRLAHPSMLNGSAVPVAPSAIATKGPARAGQMCRGLPAPRELSLREMPRIVDHFASAALLALEAGFDGVELHAANGHLIDQFLRSCSNRRSDAYGGSPLNRSRLLMEVAEAVCAIWGVERVGVRLSPRSSANGMSDRNATETFTCAVEALDQLGIAYLHVVEPVDQKRPLVPGLRRRFGGALVVAGGYGRDAAEAAIADDTADIVAFGESFIANPDLPERFRRNAPLNPLDRATIHGEGAAGYTDYPALAAEREGCS